VNCVVWIHQNKRHQNKIAYKFAHVYGSQIKGFYSNTATYLHQIFMLLYTIMTVCQQLTNLTTVQSITTWQCNMTNKAVIDHRLRPGIASCGVTLSTHHLRVAIYIGTLCANIMSWIFNMLTAAVVVDPGHGTWKADPSVCVHWPTMGIPMCLYSQVQGCMWAVL